MKMLSDDLKQIGIFVVVFKISKWEDLRIKHIDAGQRTRYPLLERTGAMEARVAIRNLQYTERIRTELEKELEFGKRLVSYAEKRLPIEQDIDMAVRARNKFLAIEEKTSKKEEKILDKQRRIYFELWRLRSKEDTRRIISIRETTEKEIEGIYRTKKEYRAALQEQLDGINERSRRLRFSSALYKELMRERNRISLTLQLGLRAYDALLAKQRRIGQLKEDEEYRKVMENRRKQLEKEAKRKRKAQEEIMEGLYRLDHTSEEIAYNDLSRWVGLEAKKLLVTKKRILESFEYQRRLEDILERFKKKSERRELPKMMLGRRGLMFPPKAPEIQVNRQQLGLTRKANVHLAKIETKIGDLSTDGVDRIVSAIEKIVYGTAYYG